MLVGLLPVALLTFVWPDARWALPVASVMLLPVIVAALARNYWVSYVPPKKELILGYSRQFAAASTATLTSLGLSFAQGHEPWGTIWQLSFCSLALIFLACWALVLRRSLWWVNALRAVMWYKSPRLVRLPSGEPNWGTCCPLARSLSKNEGGADVDASELDLTNSGLPVWAVRERFPRLAIPGSSNKLKPPLSMRLFITFFDWGLYPRLIDY